MKEPDYRGVSALAIAVCGAAGIFVLAPIVLLSAVPHGEAASHVVTALGGALIGALAAYMGGRMLHVDPPDKKPDHQQNEEN